MIRYLIQMLIALLPLAPLMGQGGFSHIYDVGGDNLPELLVLDSGFVTITQNNPDWLKLDIVEYNFQGQIVDTVSYRFDSIVKNGIENCGNCLRQYKTGRFLYAQTHFDSTVIAYIQFFKLNRDWDTISSHRYRYTNEQDSTLMTSQIFGLSFDTDSTFVITGLVYRRLQSTQTDKYDLLVARFDTSFNLLWERRVKDGRPAERFGYIGRDILLAQNGDILIGGYGFLSKNVSLICRFDNEGDLLWKRELGGSYSSGGAFIAFDSDSNVVYLCPTQKISTPTQGDGRFRYGKLDQHTGQTILDTLMGPLLFYTGPQDMIRTPDGNLLMTGVSSKQTQEQGFAFKITDNGDSLWMRFYHHGDKRDVSFIYNSALAPDSGIIHVGSYTDLYNTTKFLTYTWLLKTDKYGCVVADCQFVGVPGIPVSSGTIVAYPNPSDGVFVIKRTGTDARGPLPYAIYSTTGRCVRQGEMEGAYATINLSFVAPGLYIVVFRREGRGTTSVKLIVK